MKKLDINQEIEKLLEIKKEVDTINQLRATKSNVEVMSQARYDFLNNRNLTKPDIFYYIAPVEVGKYVEGFQG